jgi:two-component system chemotaxis response regulator CheY
MIEMAKTILIVDDSATMRKMVSEVLVKAGYQVVTRINGSDALKKIDENRIDLVITDFNMPQMGGIPLIRNLRTLPRFRFTPILVLTTETDAAKRAEGKSAGATGWVTKPFDPERLIQVVKRLAP